ncbi:MAG: ATP-binding protein [Firmicutes bacterium]|nr:ATP-binding protein [Bacillota bacterium]
MGKTRLSLQLILSITAIIVTIMTLGLYVDLSRQRQWAAIELRDKAEAVTRQFLSIRTFIASEQNLRLTGSSPSPTHHLDTMAAEKGIREIFGSGTSFSLREVWMIRPESGRTSPVSPEDEAMLSRFTAEPGLKELWEVESEGTKRVFRYMIPVYMEQSCLSCHPGDRDNPYQVGQLVGGIALRVPMEDFEKAIRTEAISRSVFTLLLILLTIIALSLLTSWLVTIPLARLSAATAKIGEGRMDEGIEDIKAINAPGEISQLAQDFARMAERLKGLYDNLEGKVAERTQELYDAYEQLTIRQEELTRINQELVKANRLKTEFLSTVTHELRTPLSAVIALTELLLEKIPGPINQKQQELLTDITESGQQLLRLINDLLDLAKIEAGKMEFYPEKVDIIGQISDVEKRMALLAQKRGLTLTTKLPPGPIWARVDRIKIEQILTNLIGNAIKFTPAGGFIEIELQAVPEGMTIQVRDTGIGIRPEDQELIFEKFRQVDGSATRAHRGTGLGLALAKHLVEMHGGRIWVESRPGAGSTFNFFLPYEDEKDT